MGQIIPAAFIHIFHLQLISYVNIIKTLFPFNVVQYLDDMSTRGKWTLVLIEGDVGEFIIVESNHKLCSDVLSSVE
jgi:hypothetical protein